METALKPRRFVYKTLLCVQTSCRSTSETSRESSGPEHPLTCGEYRRGATSAASLTQAGEREAGRGNRTGMPNCDRLLRRGPTWCWKPGLCFSRARWSFARRASLGQPRPGTLSPRPRSRDNDVKSGLCPVPLNKAVLPEAAKSLRQMESRYPPMMHRGCSTPSRSSCRCLQTNRTSRLPMATGTVWLES